MSASLWRYGAPLALGCALLLGCLIPAPSLASVPAEEWAQQTTLESPAPAVGASMAYDPAAAQMVLFGGEGSSGPSGETWAYEGLTGEWSKQSPAESPPARAWASMAYDPATGKVVLFGGDGEGGLSNETWTYDGSTWTKETPAVSPAAREAASMAYDPATGELVLFGGYGEGGYSNETWTYDGATDTWTEQSPAESPSAREGASMAYDPATGKIVLFGGYLGSYSNETWTYDAASDTWTEQSPAESPSARAWAPMTFDPATGQMVLFGGEVSGGLSNQTWTYEGSTGTWSQQSPAEGTPAREGAAMAFDPATGRLVLFGGFVASGPSNETWTYGLPAGVAEEWTEQSPAESPSARAWPVMAYDPASSEVVLFGGYEEGALSNETWTYDGSTDEWTDRSPAESPGPREGASMAYDPATGELVLFGGYTESGSSSETWTYDAASDTWTEQSPAESPAAREAATMEYDPTTGEMVLFGGRGESGLTNDTWTYDGSTDAWTQQSPAESPPARAWASMAFDPVTGELDLFGGEVSGGSSDETWAYQSSSDTWTEETPATAPPAREVAAMAFDPAIGKMVLFGGWTGSDFSNETWTYAPLAKAAPTLATTASPGVTVGGKVHDAATLSGGASPTGTITFRLYGPADASCSATPVYTSPAVSVSGDGSYESGEYTPTEPGTYRWIASYSGDSKNEATAGACGEAAETVTVSAQTSTTTTSTSTSTTRTTSTTTTATSSGTSGSHAKGSARVARSATVKGGVALVKVTCTGQGACKGSLRLVARGVQKGAGKGGRHGAARAVLIGVTSFSIAHGKVETLRVHLSAKARMLLARAGRHGLAVAVRGSDVKASTLLLKPARKA